MKIATKRKSPHPEALSQEGEGTNRVRPGDELEVTITTTDPQGKPVAAELSLAMVEQSLLERFASPLPSISDFFRGETREPAVRCTSSITFSYRPETQPINPRLLAEKDREEIAREEEESRRAAIAVATTPRAHGGSRRMIRRESRTGRAMMLGVGVNSDAGLVGNITLDDRTALAIAMRCQSDDADRTRLQDAWQISGHRRRHVRPVRPWARTSIGSPNFTISRIRWPAGGNKCHSLTGLI